MRGWTVVMAMLAAAAAGLCLFALLAPDPVPQRAEAPPVPQPAPEPAPEQAPASPEPVVATVAEARSAAPAETDALAPSFDVVRVAPDGAALAAGSAEPHAEITVRIDGETRATVKADASGGFVAYFDVPRAETEAAATRLDLASVAPDGSRAESAVPVVVAAPAADEPDAEPLVVAARETGVEVLQKPGAEAAEGSVTLERAVQDPGGVVALSGRAGGLKPVRIYANARLVAETVADADGRWTAEAAADETGGAATLRVDEIAEDGTVSRRIEAPFIAAAADLAPGPGEVMVREGDTLWRIADNVLGSGLRYTLIYQANAERIRDPDLIYPGQILSVPGAAAR